METRRGSSAAVAGVPEGSKIIYLIRLYDYQLIRADLAPI
jgi:hypothetical protein